MIFVKFLNHNNEHPYIDRLSFPSNRAKTGVYRYLAVLSLATGSPSSIDDFSLSCKTIHNEIKSDIVSKVGDLLDIQRSWNSISETDALLRIQLSGDHESTLTLREFTLAIPMSSQFDPRGKLKPRLPTFFDLLSLLRRVLRIPLSTLKIEFYHRGLPGTSIYYRASIGILDSLFWCLMRWSDDEDVPYFSRLQHLVVRLGTFGASGDRLRSDAELRFILRRLQQQCGWREVKRLRGTNEGMAQDQVWTLWFDFEEGLPWMGSDADEFEVCGIDPSAAH